MTSPNKGGIIYKATSPSGKVYIGLTTRSLAARKASHRSALRRFLQKGAITNRFFLNALKKYSFEAFTWEVIDRADNIDDLRKLEIKYITEFKSMDRQFGYNLREGGDGGAMSDATKTYLKDLWSRPERKLQRSEQTKSYINTPEHKLLMQNICAKIWTKEKCEAQRSLCKDGMRPVVDGLGLTYDSVTACAKAYGLERRALADILVRGREKSNKQYAIKVPVMVEYLDTTDADQVERIISLQNSIKAVKSSDGHFFLSIKEAARQLQTTPFFIKTKAQDGRPLDNGLFVCLVESSEMLRWLLQINSK